MNGMNEVQYCYLVKECPAKAGFPTTPLRLIFILHLAQ